MFEFYHSLFFFLLSKKSPTISKATASTLLCQFSTNVHGIFEIIMLMMGFFFKRLNPFSIFLTDIPPPLLLDGLLKGLYVIVHK